MKNGKVITLPLQEAVRLGLAKIEEGQQVYWIGCPSKVKIWNIRSFRHNQIEISPNMTSARSHSPNISDLCVVVIKYLKDPEKSAKNYAHIPLTDGYWGLSIRKELLNTDTFVDFEIGMIPTKGYMDRHEISLNPDDNTTSWFFLPNPKMYTEDEVLEKIREFNRAHSIQVFDSFITRWWRQNK